MDYDKYKVRSRLGCHMDYDKYKEMGIEKDRTNFANDPENFDVNEDNEKNDLSESSEELGMDEGVDRVSNANMTNALTPKIGMTFKTVDEAYQFYNYYAYRIGFGIAKTCSRRKDGVQHEYTFSCEKGGKPKDKKGLTPKRARTSKKTGCQAKFRVRLNEDGLWHLAFLVLHHNHYCSPNESHHYRSHRMMPFHVMPLDAHKQLEPNVQEEGSPDTAVPLFASHNRGQQDPSPIERNCTNYIDKVSHLKLGEGDAQAIIDYFCRVQKESPLFFYLVDLDGEGRLRNAFWADTKSRTSYPYFSDTVLFDTNYIMNKYHIPFASFIGINHHGSLVLFGGALLSDERSETYAWLFRAWLTCMGDVAPKAIITDKCKSIDSAISDVFPSTLHRLCIWQIMKRVPEKLGGYSEHKAIKERLCDIVYDSLRVEEFQQSWENMINEYKLGDNEWLMSLYEDRKRWAPVFVKDTFWAGMSSIQRSESRIPYFDRFVTSKRSLKQFIMAYEDALQAKYDKEFQEEYGCKEQNPHFISRLDMEEDSFKLYTPCMFQKFQRELQKCVDCTCALIRKDGAVSTYEVKERVKQRTYIYEVLFNEDKVEVQCLCRGFEFGGILCSHAIVVLKEKDVHRIPTRYICDRWRKNFKDDRHVLISSDNVVPRPCERFDKLYLQCLQHLSKLVEIGASSDDRYEYLLKLLVKVEKKLTETGKNQKGKGREKGNQNGSTSKSRVAEFSGRIPASDSLPNLPGGVQLINEMATQGIVPYYLVSLGEQAANDIASSISTSQTVTDLWSQRHIIFPNVTQSSNQ